MSRWDRADEDLALVVGQYALAQVTVEEAADRACVSPARMERLLRRAGVAVDPQNEARPDDVLAGWER